jgi:uncharacterized membrane protein
VIGAAPHLVPLLALGGAMLTAAAAILIHQGLRGADAYSGFWINLAVGTALLWTAVLVTGPHGRISASGLAWFALAGLLGTVAGRLLRFVAIEKVGASVASALINLTPLVATGTAILFLGERVTLPIVAGTAVIVVGTTLLSVSGARVGFPARYLWLPILSAVCLGGVQVLRKLGLGHMGPVLGFAVNVTAALLAFSTFLLASRGSLEIRARGRSLACFLAAGVAENAGVLLNVVALNVGTVSVVSPLTGSAPIFVLLLSSVFLRGVETLTARIVAGTVLIVAGVYLITAL